MTDLKAVHGLNSYQALRLNGLLKQCNSEQLYAVRNIIHQEITKREQRVSSILLDPKFWKPNIAKIAKELNTTWDKVDYQISKMAWQDRIYLYVSILKEDK